MVVAEAPKQQQGALYTLWPKQQEAMQLLGLGPDWRTARQPVEELLFGGEAGGGKSALLRAVGVTLCTIWPGAVVPLFRRTYPELEETHIRRIQAEVPRTIATYHTDRHELRFPNGSVLEFRYCEGENDVFRYQSAEFDGLLIDESTHFTEFQVRYLRSRVRSTRPEWRPVIVYGSNPGNLGHAYFKGAFVDAGPAGKKFRAPANDGALVRCFLRSSLEDNPSLGADYRRMLEGIADETLRRALLEGDWSVFSGMYFTAWRRNKHVCQPFAIPPDWRIRRVSVDFGFGAPWSTHFYVRDEDLWREQRIHRWYVYREFYRAGVRDEDQAKYIAAALRNEVPADEHQPRPAFQVVGDPSMWNKKPDGVSIAQVYAKHGVSMIPANNDRVPGWQRLREYLSDQEDGLPALIYFENCREAVRTIPTLVHDKVQVEDLDTDGEDHAADDARYFVMNVGPIELHGVDRPRYTEYGWGGKDRRSGRSPRLPAYPGGAR